MSPATQEFEIDLSPEPVTDDGVTSLELADGSVELTFGPEEEQLDLDSLPFDANLAEYLPNELLAKIGMEIIAEIDADIQTREPWERMYTEGLSLLGMKSEEKSTPWKGACSMWHPMLAEALVRFQSNAIMEIFPASGPVKTKILGKITEAKEEQAERLQEYMNFTLTERMPDYRNEKERQLWGIGACGAGFTKGFRNPVTGAPDSQYVRAQDFIAPYGVSSLSKAPRYAERMYLSINQVKKLQASGHYRQDVTPMASIRINSQLQDKIDAIQPVDQPPYNDEDCLLYESHRDTDIMEPDGISRPYIITVDDRGQVLSIYRNWKQDDPLKQKILWYAAYSYIPADGIYGYGLIHLIGQASYTASSLLRQLVDAGTLSNLPGGMKAKGTRMPGDTSPIAPGEWRDVDVPTGKIAEAFFPLPYKEPSSVLFSLLQNIVEEGRRLGSIPDAEVGDINGQAPVGTALAILERALKVMSAVQARLHASMHDEFKILARVIAESTPEEYEYDVEGGTRKVKRADFNGAIDIIPVSDPNAATMAQRVTQFQAAMQMSQTAPQIYDLPKLHRKGLGIMGFKDVDEIIPDDDDVKPADPISENMAIITGKPVKAYEFQNHQAHIAVHGSFISDPMTAQMMGQNPQAQAIMAAAQAHIAEHYAYLYREQMAKALGFPLPPMDEPLPGDVEANLSFAVAAASDRLLNQHKSEAAQKQAQQQAQDPVLQLQKAEVELKAKDIEMDAAAKGRSDQIKVMQITESEKTKRMKIQADMAVQQEKAIDENEQFLAQFRLEQQRSKVEMDEIKAKIAEILARISG